MSDFATSFRRLRVAVSVACRPHPEWPARVSAGIHGTVDFAVADPSAARTLTVNPAGSAATSGHREMIDHFAAELGRGAPRDRRLPVSTDKAVVRGIATMVGGHVRTDRTSRLTELAPELVYLTLLPYLGFTEAKRWAEVGDR